MSFCINNLVRLNSMFFRSRILWILSLLLLHLIGALILGSLFFMFAEYILGSLGFYGGKFIGYLWDNLNRNFWPPLILLLSLIVITVSNPIYALISLILIFFITALFLLSIHIEFLAFIYIIVYLGAIAILFLFVLMMFNLKELQKAVDYSQSASFLIFSLSFYLFLLYKFYYLLIHIFLAYVEYDAYINDMVVLRFKVLYSHSRDLYISFIQDLILDLGKAVSEWRSLGIDPYNISTLLENKNGNQKNEIIKQIYTWYIKKDNLPSGNFDFNSQNIDFLVKQLLEDNLPFTPLYKYPTDILIYGQILYTYYCYLFLLVTFVLLIAMIGAIILALSTTEKSTLISSKS